MSVVRLLCVLALCGVICFPASPAPKMTIYIGEQASSLEQQAALELRRFLFEGFDLLLPLEKTSTLSTQDTGFVLGTPDTLPQLPESYPYGMAVPAHDGYLLHSLKSDKPGLVVIAAPMPLGVQNGVFGLLEHLGFGFLPSGHTLPRQAGRQNRLSQLPIVHETFSPVFSTRGSFPWLNKFCGSAVWSPADYRMD